jgi:hypothetical protein
MERESDHPEEKLESRAPTLEDLSSIYRDLDEVPIPFASPKMLYKMKKRTHREKDRADPPVPAGELC